MRDIGLPRELAPGIFWLSEYLVPTHSEVPPAANLASLLDRYPESLVYGDVRGYHLSFPEVVDPRWGYSTAQRCLFPGDGFAYMHHHHHGECGMTAEECPNLPVEEFTTLFAEYALYWTRCSLSTTPLS